MLVQLLNGALNVNVHFEKNDSQYDDNICLCFEEPCHDDEKIFRAESTHLFLTPKEARELAQALSYYADKSDYLSHDAI